MSLRLPLLAFLFVAFTKVAAQQDSTGILLDAIEVQGYRYNRPITETPISVGLLSSADFMRFSDQSFLPAVNLIPGVRMEERSPGSYRFSIRGSLIRSPFGVRNVKVYWNGFPLTDGGGNTYLNLVDFSSVQKMEIIKGPGGSLYGAGTGGVVMFTTLALKETSLEASSAWGSYGFNRYVINGNVAGAKTNASIQYVHQSSNGYREQSALARDGLHLNLSHAASRNTLLSASIFYTDIFYQTPGGLTKAQFDEDATQARPSGQLPGAVQQNALVNNKSFFGGLNMQHDWSSNFSTVAGVYMSSSDFENFAIRNYETRDETNLGTRIENQLSVKKKVWTAKVSFGGEFQHFDSPVNVYSNNGGVKGDLSVSDELGSRQLLLFVQAEVDLPSGFLVTVGASESFLKYDFVRDAPDESSLKKNFKAIFSPRVAVLKKINNALSIYTSVSRGFSPPSLVEVRPSTDTFNENLTAESGTNYELGIRGGGHSFSFDVTSYLFDLSKTIVIQRTTDGAEYFVNAGKTKQKGIEATLSFAPVNVLKIWGSYAYQHYRFSDYVNDDNDYSGNKLTGVPPTTSTLGLDVTLRQGFYLNTTSSYTDHIPLNDANDEFSEEYILFNARVGFRKKLGDNFQGEVFAAVDNLLDERYSLGNDLNAGGRRYYNAAPGRNFVVGLKIKSIFSSKNG